MDPIGLAAAGPALTRQAQQRADDAANRVVQNPADASALVDLSRAEREGEIGARLIRAHDDLTGTLLDVLA
jgi:hypothetical protein